MSSVQLVDEAAAERQRVDLINRLVKEALSADFDGGWGRTLDHPSALHVGCRHAAVLALVPRRVGMHQSSTQTRSASVVRLCCPAPACPGDPSTPLLLAGAIEGLKSLKQARLTDPATGQSFGLVRLYADPGEPQPAAAHKPHHKPAKAHSHAHRGGGGAAGGKPVQVRSAATAAAAALPAASWLLPCACFSHIGVFRLQAARTWPQICLALGAKTVALPPSCCQAPHPRSVPSTISVLLQLRHHHHPAVAQGARNGAHVLQRLRHLQEDSRHRAAAG